MNNKCYKTTNFPYIEKEFDAATTYEEIAKLHGDFDETLDELNTRLMGVDQDIEDIKSYVDTQMVSQEYVDIQDAKILKQAKEYTDQNSSFNVTIEKDGFGNYIADYNDNDINNARNSGKVVQAKYYDNINNQTYTYYYSTMKSDRRPTFIRTYNEGNKVIQVLASVDYDKKVEVLRKIVDVDKLIEPVNNEVDLLTGEVSDVKQDIIATNKGVVKNTARIQNIEGTLYDNGVASGEFINIKDSALAEQQEVELGVNKAQETTEGYNLVKSYLINTQNNLYTDKIYADFDLKPNITYTIKFNTNASMYLYCNEKIFTRQQYLNTQKTNKMIVTAKGSFPDKNYIGGKGWRLFKNAKDNTGILEISDFVIYEGTEDKPYEPYTGGIPSPNPDYKQEINKITGSVEYTSTGKNLNNAEQEKGGIDDSGNDIVDNSLVRNIGYIKVVPKQEYTVSSTNIFSLTLYLYDKDKNFVKKVVGSPAGLTFTASDNIYFMRYTMKSLHLDKKPQIEIGPKATALEDYQEIVNTIDLKGNIADPGDKIYLRFNVMTGKYEKILKKNYTHSVIELKSVSTQGLTYDKYLFDKPLDSADYGDDSNNFAGIYYCTKAIQYDDWSNYDATHYSIFTAKGDTLENMKVKYDGAEYTYKLKEPYEINLGEIDIMNMTYYPTTNAFTDKENVLINMKYYRDFTNTIKNIQIDVNNIPTKTSQLENDSGFVTSNEIKKMQVVTELPEVEEPNVLYLVAEIPSKENLYYQDTLKEYTSSSGITYKFDTNKNVTLSGTPSKDASTYSNDFNIDLKPNTQYKMEVEKVSGSIISSLDYKYTLKLYLNAESIDHTNLAEINVANDDIINNTVFTPTTTGIQRFGIRTYVYGTNSYNEYKFRIKIIEV